MANTFKNYTYQNVGTSNQLIYTVPAATTAVVIGMNIANTRTYMIKVDVVAGGVYIVKDAPIPAGSALSVLDGKIILEAGDTVAMSSDSLASADVIVSVLEQS
jgi:hypothetical protein